MKFFESDVENHSDDTVEEIAPEGSERDGITFIVTKGGHVFYTWELTRHLSLLSRTVCSPEDIAWGGILNDRGDWVRKSYDFGDAPDLETRRSVVSQIQNAIYS